MTRIDVDAAALPLDQPIRVEANGTGIVVVRTCERIVAYRDRCPHAGWRLSLGTVRDGRLECPGHGWEFLVATGECPAVPACGLRPLPVVSAGDTIHIDAD
jgi:nitrite reductase/ring-hydroxylating ferredoxin subunit